MLVLEKYISPICKFLIFLYMLYKLGIISGFIYYFSFYFFFIKLVENIFGLELVMLEDLIFTLEQPKCPNAIITSIIMERLSMEEFKQIFKEKVLKKFKRMNQSIIFKISEYYWNTHELNKGLENIKRLKLNLADKGLKNVEKEGLIKSFIEKKFAKHLSPEKPIWRIYYCENYSEDKSLFILNFHHCLGDGSALLNLFSSLSNVSGRFNNAENNPIFKKITFFHKALIYLFSPIAFFLMQPKAPGKGFVNPLMQYYCKPQGLHSLEKSKDMNLDILKNKILQYKQNAYFSINDFLVFLINKSIKDFIDYNHAQTSSLNNPQANTKENRPIRVFSNICDGNNFSICEQNKCENSTLLSDKEIKDYNNKSLFNKPRKTPSLLAILGMSYRFELKDNELGNCSSGANVEYELNYYNGESDSINYNNSNTNIVTRDNRENDLSEIKKIAQLNSVAKTKKFNLASGMKMANCLFSIFINKHLSIKQGNDNLKHITYLFSNIKGIDTFTDVQGKKILDITGYLPHGALLMTFLAVSYNNKLKITMHTDKSFGLDSGLLIEMINKNYENFICDH